MRRQTNIYCPHCNECIGTGNIMFYAKTDRLRDNKYICRNCHNLVIFEPEPPPPPRNYSGLWRTVFIAVILAVCIGLLLLSWMFQTIVLLFAISILFPGLYFTIKGILKWRDDGSDNGSSREYASDALILFAVFAALAVVLFVLTSY